MKKADIMLQEVKLARVWQHFTNPNVVVAILTAFRGEYPYDENVRRNNSLAAEIKRLGYGYFYVDGHWVENAGTPEARTVNEDSIFVIGPAKKEEQFVQDMERLGQEFNQEAVLIKDQSGTALHFADGGRMELGDIKPGQLGDIYTKLRTNKKASSFIFEAERDSLGWISRLAGIKDQRVRTI